MLEVEDKYQQLRRFVSSYTINLVKKLPYAEYQIRIKQHLRVLKGGLEEDCDADSLPILIEVFTAANNEEYYHKHREQKYESYHTRNRKQLDRARQINHSERKSKLRIVQIKSKSSD